MHISLTKILIISMFLIFSGALVALWTWVLRNEAELSNKVYNTAMKAFNAKKYRKAEALFQEAISIWRNNFKARYQLGHAFLKLEKYENAKACFEKVIKSEPQNTDAKFWLAYTLQQMKLLDESEILYKSVLKDNPAHYNCIIQIGLINFENSKYDEALTNFEKAEKIAEEKVLCNFYITKCKDKMCTYETKEEGQIIIEEYLKIIDEPILPNGYYLALATAYAKTGQIKESLKYCEKSLEENTEDFESYKLLGLIQLVHKDYEGVKNTLATAISLQSDNAELHTILSYALCQQDNMCAVKKCREKYGEIIKNFIKPSTNQSNNV